MVKCFGQGDDYSACNGLTIGTTKMTPNNAKNLVNDIIAVLASAINLLLSGGLQMVSDGPNGTYQKKDLVKAVLAGRCVLTGGVTDMWKLIMAAYYAARAFGFQRYVIQGLNYVPPYVCACKKMVESWSNMFGSSGSSTAAELSSCSESGSTATSS